MFTSIKNLDRTIAQSFAPGEQVELLIGIPRSLTAEEVELVKARLLENGIAAEYGETLDWPHALRLQVIVNDYSGTGALPLAAVIIAAIGAVGIVSFVGVSITNAISRNFVPVLLIAGGFFLLLKLIKVRA